MKKIALSLVVLMTIGLAACTQKAAEAEQTVDSDSIKAAEAAALVEQTNDSDTTVNVTVEEEVVETPAQ